MKVEFSSHFLRKAKKLTPSEQKRLSEKIEILKKDPANPKLRTHALTGKLKGLYAFSLSFSKRVIFTYVAKNKALFVDVGSHGEVYK